MNKAISHERLISVVRYNADTGTFIWQQTLCNKHKNKSYAGSVTRAGYLIISIDNVRYLAHRLAWFYVHKEWPEDEIDHINRDRLDNRIANLRVVSRQLNARNLSHRKDNSSGVTGVHWNEHRKAWQPCIRLNNKTIHLGRTNNFLEACCRRKSAELRYFGEFARNA